MYYKDISIIQGNAYDLIKSIPDNSIDLIVTDPSYLYYKKGNGKNTQYNSMMEGVKDELYQEFFRVLKKVNIYQFCNLNQFEQIFQNYKDYKKQLLIWHKPNGMCLSQHEYWRTIEYIWYIREKGATFNKDVKRNPYYQTLNLSSELHHLHPTVKPLNLVKKFIEVSSKPGDLVFDPFVGSGTTAVACQQLGRRFIGFEKEEKYIEVCQKRLDGVITDEL